MNRGANRLQDLSRDETIMIGIDLIEIPRIGVLWCCDTRSVERDKWSSCEEAQKQQR